MAMKLRDIKDVEKRRTFKAVMATIVEEDDKTIVEIPDDPPVAVTREDRKLFEQARSENLHGHEAPWRWVGSAVLTVLRFYDQEGLYVPLIERGAGAPSYPGHLTVGAGLAADEYEWLYPSLTGWRETTEELIGVAERSIFFPWMADDHLGGVNVELEKIAENNLEIVNRFCEADDMTPVEARCVPLKDAGDIEIRWRHFKSQLYGSIYLDPKHNAADFLMGAIMLELPCRRDDIRFLCGELGKHNRPYNEKVWLCPVERQADNTFSVGKAVAQFRSARPCMKGAGPTPEKFVPYVPYILSKLNLTD